MLADQAHNESTEIHWAMDMGTKELAPEHRTPIELENNSKCSYWIKVKLAGNLSQPLAASLQGLVDKSINRENPKHCHFQLLNQYPTTFFDQEVEYTYIILYS